MKAEYLKLFYVLLKTEVRRETEKNEAKEIGRNKKPKGILSPLELDFHKPLLTASLSDDKESACNAGDLG